MLQIPDRFFFFGVQTNGVVTQLAMLSKKTDQKIVVVVLVVLALLATSLIIYALNNKNSFFGSATPIDLEPIASEIDEEIIDIEPNAPEEVQETTSASVDTSLSSTQVAFIVNRIFKEVMGEVEASAPLFDIVEDRTGPEEIGYSWPLIIKYEDEKQEKQEIPLKKVLEAIDWKNPQDGWENNKEQQFDKFCKFSELIADHFSSVDDGLIQENKTLPFIYKYSINYYDNINKFLRTGRIPLRVDQIDVIDTFAKALLFASIATSNELASIRGKEKELIVYRKVAFQGQYNEKSFSKGPIYIEPGFCSASTNLEGFTMGLCYDATLIIKTTNGKFIENFVAHGMKFEKEVLIPPGQKFKVESIKKIKFSSIVNWEISLTQV